MIPIFGLGMFGFGGSSASSYHMGYDLTIEPAMGSRPLVRDLPCKRDFELPPAVDTWSAWFRLSKWGLVIAGLLTAGLIIKILL